MKKRMVMMIIALVIVFGGLVAFNVIRSTIMKHHFATYQAPPQVISASVAKNDIWHPKLTAVGTMEAYNGVNVTPQNQGQVVKIFFSSGDMVHTGQPLVQQDIRTDLEVLKNYQASEAFYHITYKRQLDLSKRGFVSLSDLDQTLSQWQQAQANVGKTEVTIHQKTIRAPFDGKIGIRLANLGQYLSPGDNIASLQQLNPLRVIFSLPEQNFSDLKVGQNITLTSDAYPNKTFTGKIDAINSNVSQETRNIQVEGRIENPNLLLYPGMFANIQVSLPQKDNVLTVPQTAINYSLSGDSIYVLTPDSSPKDAKKQKKKVKGNNKDSRQVYIAKTTFIKTGSQRGNEVAVTHGALKAGDLVVTSGQLKLVNGSRVVIQENVNMNDKQTVDTDY